MKDSFSGSWLYILACISLPAAWGAFAAYLFSLRDKNKRSQKQQSSIDYMI